MDILKEIAKQIESIRTGDDSVYLDQIFNHIDRAEKYYLQGHTDEHYFNDVIYRSNQAYEGALKEAYKILADKTEGDLHNTNPFKIEKYFKENLIFRARVLQLFENYRQEWRNKSTHDYKLVFDENEAFIALTSVSSFVHLLLKQIQEKLAFKNEQKRLENQEEELKKLKEKISLREESLAEKIVNIIKEFIERNEYIVKSNLLEVEILGMLHGFLSMADEDLEILREPKINDRNIRPDFLISYADDKIILEVKRMFERNRLNDSIEQVIMYLEATGLSDGIVYYVQTVGGKPIANLETRKIERNNKKYNIYLITT